MGFKRAQWKSGLVYQQTCTTCKGKVTYTDDYLDFRPWYADGFVDCPTCGTHLRHNERYAIDSKGNPSEGHTPQAEQSTEGGSAFCSRCGRKFGADHLFCTGCGAKRD